MGSAHSSPIQDQAAQQQAALNREEVGLMRDKNAREQAQYELVRPFATDRLQNGLPYFNALTDYAGGTLSRAYQPAYMRLAKQFGTQGVPSGSYNSALTALDADKARSFDQNMVGNLAANEQAKKDAASLLTNQQQMALQSAAGNANTATQGNGAIFNSQALMTQGSPLASILGGVAGSALGGILGNPNLGKQGGIPF